MGRSQRHMLWEQSTTAAGEIIAQGVVAPGIALQVDPEQYNVVKEGPPLLNTGQQQKPNPKVGEGAEDIVVPIGEPGGPLRGSSLTGAIPEAITPPPEPEPEPDPNAPSISSLNPTSTPINTAVQVTLTGTNFSADCVVKVDGNQVVSAFVSDTSMTADLPGFATAATMSIVVEDTVTTLGSSAASFEVTAVQEEGGTESGTRAFPLGPFDVAIIEDHPDGIQLTLTAAADVQIEDTVLVEATFNSSINGSYAVLESDGTAIVVDNPVELAAPIEAKGRVTVTA